MMRILLVEDDQVDAKTMQRASAELGMDLKVDTVANGAEALRYLNAVLANQDSTAQAPDLILMDWNMPVMDGREFLRERARAKPMRQIPVVMLSGVANDADVGDSYALGAAGFFEKPLSVSAYVDMLHRMVLYWTGNMPLTRKQTPIPIEPEPHTGTRMLVVDDDEVDRQAIRRWVMHQSEPYLLCEAASLAEAYRESPGFQFDVVLLDYNLGDGSGIEALEFFKQRDVPVIVCTGQGSELVAVSALREGAMDYIVKDPNRVYLQFLHASIDAVLKRRKAERERDMLIADLRDALTHIRTLRGIIPICSSCKKVRTQGGAWERLETFISRHSLAEFSHGYCPDCARQARNSLNS